MICVVSMSSARCNGTYCNVSAGQAESLTSAAEQGYDMKIKIESGSGTHCLPELLPKKRVSQSKVE